MPLRKATKKHSFADQQYRRSIKTPAAKNKEAKKILINLVKSLGGSVIYLENRQFKLNLSFLDLTSLPVELFEDEFVYKYCITYLVGIEASNNKLEVLDDEIGDFINLVTLDFSKNR